jgi:hypothetical protein
MDDRHHRPSAAHPPQRGAAGTGAGRAAADRPPPRPSKIDAYLPFIRQTLESFPTLTASRLYVIAYGQTIWSRRWGPPASPRAKSAAWSRRSTAGVNAVLGRPIEGDWPYLWIDATYVKAREAGRCGSDLGDVSARAGEFAT